MSFITRCPACATAFRVVPDQLKISEGWVRCGHCQQIFDATLDLQPWWPGTEGGAPAPAQVSGVALPRDAAPGPEPTAETTPDAPPKLPVAPVTDGGSDSGSDSSRDTGQDAASITNANADADVELNPPALDPAFDPALGPAQSPPVEESREPELAPTPTRHGEPLEPYLAPLDDLPQAQTDDQVRDAPMAASPPPSDPPAAADEPTPSFVRQAQRRAYWRRPWVRAVLALCGLVLLVLATLQSALHWRDLWAARVPALVTPLATLCGWADCVVETPRRLSEVVIDSSVLLRKEPGRYIFNAVLRNQSELEVAAPSLELTLTDAQDQVLVRRVLSPQEWPEPVATLAPRSERPLQLELDLSFDETQVMTGYRALLFYP